MANLDDRWWRAFDLRFVLCPVTVAYHQNEQRFGSTVYKMEWKSLYFFGIRLARWRVD